MTNAAIVGSTPPANQNAPAFLARAHVRSLGGPDPSGAISIARTLLLQQHASFERREGDVTELEQSIRALERLVGTVEGHALVEQRFASIVARVRG
jgi:hypothetical protein